jgi:hypothetical protein
VLVVGFQAPMVCFGIHTRVLVAVIAAVGLVGYLSFPLYRDVYAGVPASIPISEVRATCDAGAASATCGTLVSRLNAGRFRVATTIPASRVTMTVADAPAIARTRFLLVRTSVPGRLGVAADLPAAGPEILGVDVHPGERQAIDLRDGRVAPSSQWSRITFAAASPQEPIVVDEIGFLESRDGLLRPPRQPFQRIPAARFYSVFAPLATLALCAFVVVAVWLAPSRSLSRIGPWLMAALCASIGMLELGTTFSPYWSRDLRSVYAAELVRSGPDGNLTGGLYEGSRLVQGLGQTVPSGPGGTVQWHRMPGYGLFSAVAAAIGRTTDLIEIAMLVIVLQLIVYSASLGIFMVAAQRVFAPGIAWLMGVSLAILPKQIANTQVDAIVAAIALLVMAALLTYLAEEQERGTAAFRTYCLVNLAFALWFLMRNDVLPGWIAVSLVLSWRRWHYFLVPVALIATIALPWALYKRQYRHTFDLMPTNTGEVMFLSLCEVPGRFPFACTDAGYFDWAARNGESDPTSRRASTLAIREVVRHWITYPVHFAFMVWFKFRRCVYNSSWPGFQTPFNQPYIVLREAGGFLYLLAVVAVSLLVDHQRRRSMLLGWALFFNMPLFFVMFESSGRFYPAAGVALNVLALALLFERGLYVQMARRPWRAAAVAACVAAFVVAGEPVERWITANDAVHYWAPLLDPAASTLGFARIR